MASAMDDIPVWEMSKENAAPLARGRNIKTLEKNSAKVKSKEEQGDYDRVKQRFERLVDLDDSKDPLVDWISYIKFHQESYPSDTHAQFLLMERCARKLVHVDKYKNDVRFIRICVIYADKTDYPGDVFKFLHQHKVGVGAALFWTAWAWVAEQKADYAFAEKLFSKGISKEAQPIELLQRRHKQFQARISRQLLQEYQNDQLDEHRELEDSGRVALGGLSKEQIIRNDRQSRRTSGLRTQETQRNSRLINGTSTEILALKNHQKGNPPSSTIEIFVDENVSVGDEAFDLNDSLAEAFQQELEPQASQKKENVGKPERWNERGGYESTFSRSSGSRDIALCPGPSFEIHQDEECETAQSKAIQEYKQQFEKGGRTLQKREREDMAEKLARDPTRYMKNPEKLEKDKK